MSATEKFAIRLHYRGGICAYISEFGYRTSLSGGEMLFNPWREVEVGPRKPKTQVITFDLERDADLIEAIRSMRTHPRLKVFGKSVLKVEFVPAHELRCDKVDASMHDFVAMFSCIAGEQRLIPSGYAYSTSAA